MKPAPANVISYPKLGAADVIGLLLARLLAYLVRLQVSGGTTVPPDIAYMVASADLMVHDLICYLAERRLCDAGYLDEAEVLRAADIQRPVCAPSATTSPAELIARLEATRTLFEQAEVMSEHLARLVVCLYCFLDNNIRRPSYRIMVMAGQAWLIPHDYCLSLDPWPPPIRIASTNPLAA